MGRLHAWVWPRSVLYGRSSKIVPYLHLFIHILGSIDLHSAMTHTHCPWLPRFLSGSSQPSRGCKRAHPCAGGRLGPLSVSRVTAMSDWASLLSSMRGLQVLCAGFESCGKVTGMWAQAICLPATVGGAPAAAAAFMYVCPWQVEV